MLYSKPNHIGILNLKTFGYKKINLFSAMKEQFKMHYIHFISDTIAVAACYQPDCLICFNLINGKLLRQPLYQLKIDEFIIDREENMLYAISSDTDSLYYINLSTFELITVLKVAANPKKIYLSDDHKHIYILSLSNGQIYIINTIKKMCENIISTPPLPLIMEYDSENNYFFVFCYQYLNCSYIYKMNCSGEILIKNKLDIYPYNIRLLKNKHRLFVSDLKKGTINLYNSLDLKIMKTYQIHDGLCYLFTIEELTGNCYLYDERSNRIIEIDINSNVLKRSICVENNMVFLTHI